MCCTKTSFFFHQLTENNKQSCGLYNSIICGGPGTHLQSNLYEYDPSVINPHLHVVLRVLLTLLEIVENFTGFVTVLHQTVLMYPAEWP